MDYSDAAKKLKEHKDKLKVDAENRILHKFPERILSLNEILNKPEFRISDLEYAKEVSSLKIEINEIDFDAKNSGKRPREDSNTLDTLSEQKMIPSNDKIIEFINILKPNVNLLMEDANVLKMWVSLLIPKVEDGNNFGVSVQEDALGEIMQVEAEANSYLQVIARYFVGRGKLISQVMKYPLIEDYRRAIEDLDERQYLAMSLTMIEIHNRYLTLHDIVIKNLDKIKTPRSSNTDCLY